MHCGFSMMESESSEYVDAYADWVELKAALKRKDEELLTKRKEVEEMLKQGTQAAERVKMLEKEVEEGREAMEEEKQRNCWLEKEVWQLKRKVGQWEKEEHKRWWKAKKAKIDQEKKEQLERDIRNRVWIEETERRRVRDKLAKSYSYGRK